MGFAILRDLSVLFLPGKSKQDRIALVARPGHVKMGTGYADVAQGLDPVEGWVGGLEVENFRGEAVENEIP